MPRTVIITLVAIFYVLFDWYIYQALRLSTEGLSPVYRRFIYVTYFVLSVGFFVGIWFVGSLDVERHKILRMFLMSGFFSLLIGKLFVGVFLLFDDLRRGIVALINMLPAQNNKVDTSRSEFMSKAALVAGAVPIATLSFGILSGAYDYRVRKRIIHSKNLPKAFDGIRIAQISDIHTGSFFNKTAVQGGVDLLNAEKPDVFFFTGDLVNERSSEAKPYLDIFKKIKAPLGTYSTMGNHDYADYSSMSPDQKEVDIRQLHEMHAYMGWDLLLNENRTLTESGEKLAIIGVENWGAGRFSKYGDLQKSLEGTSEHTFKLLLSHDPTHWDAQVRANKAHIDLTLSGHTHGMQFGVEIGNFRWSPSQYIYDRWADMYQEGDQYLYVNRGYGFIGYPGRVGILPEITILELKSV